MRKPGRDTVSAVTMSSAPPAATPPVPAVRRAPSHLAAKLRPAIAAIVPAVLLTAYALIPEPPYGSHPFEDAWRRHALVGIALLIWVGALLLARRLPRRIPLLAPLLLLPVVECLSVAAAPDWRIGVEPVLDLVAGIVIFAAVVDSPGLRASSLRWSLMLAALGLSIACLTFVWGRWIDWRALVQAVPDAGGGLFPPTVPRVLGAGTNPNVVAPLMTFAAPLYLLSVVESRGWRRGALLAAAFAVQLGVFFTLSRSAWAGEVAGLALATVLLVLAGGRVHPPSKRAARRLAAAGVALAFLAGIVVVALPLGSRPQWLFRPTFSARSDFRSAALEMIRAHPLLGSGPGSFSLNYPYFSNGDPAGAVHSHNVPIEIAVESGFLGLLAAALVLATAVATIWRTWKRGTRAQRYLVASVAGAFANFAVSGTADALHLFPEILFGLAMLMAIAVRVSRQDACTSGPPHCSSLAGGLVSGMMRVTPLALGVALLLAWFRIDQANVHYARSIEFAGRQRWPEAAAEAERAGTLDPAMPLYYAQAGVTLSLEAERIAPGDIAAQERAGTATAAAPIRARAINDLRRVLRLEPRSSVTRLDLAVLLELDGRHEQALAQLPAMLAGAPRDSLVLLAAGVLEEAARPDLAVAAYSSALAESPRIADSPFWQATSFRRQHYGEIVQSALSLAGNEDSSSGSDSVRHIIADAAGISIPGGGPAGPFVGRIDLARWYIRQGDGGAASQILIPAVRERPDDPSVRLALGELDAAQGNLRAARREWLSGAYLGDVESIMHLGDTSPGGRVPPRILDLGNWGLADLWDRQFSVAVQDYRFAYRRQEPLPIVLPGDWLNALPALYSQLRASVDRWEANQDR